MSQIITIPAATGGGGVTAHSALSGLGNDDHTQYALLAGRSGGQTLIGGTATTNKLTLRTTTGVGAAGADMVFQGGNNGATEFARFLNSGSLGIGLIAPGSMLSVTGGISVGFSYASSAAPSSGLLVQGQVLVGATSGSGTIVSGGLIESQAGGFLFPDSSVQITAANGSPWQTYYNTAGGTLVLSDGDNFIVVGTVAMALTIYAAYTAVDGRLMHIRLTDSDADFYVGTNSIHMLDGSTGATMTLPGTNKSYIFQSLNSIWYQMK